MRVDVWLGMDGEFMVETGLRIGCLLIVCLVLGCGSDDDSSPGGEVFDTGPPPFTGTENGGEGLEGAETANQDVVTSDDVVEVTDVVEPPPEDVNQTPVPCDDGIPCTLETMLENDGSCGGGRFICGDCVGSACEIDLDCEPYLDGNACNGILICKVGQCRVDTPTVITCEGILPHLLNTRVRCNPVSGECEESALPNGQACDDEEGCTMRDKMIDGHCSGVDVCTPCADLGEGEACDDGDPCTSSTACVSGRCIGEYTCECETTATCAHVEDENACNGKLVCVAGACELDPESLVHCQRACPTESCYQGTCLEAFGLCVGVLDETCEEF